MNLSNVQEDTLPIDQIVAEGHIISRSDSVEEVHVTARDVPGAERVLPIIYHRGDLNFFSRVDTYAFQLFLLRQPYGNYYAPVNESSTRAPEEKVSNGSRYGSTVAIWRSDSKSTGNYIFQ